MDSQDAKTTFRLRKYLAALGSNLPGNVTSPVEVLELALTLFGEHGLRITARSRWYRSPAYPLGSGPEFVNGAVAFEANREPNAVLHDLHAIEAQLGRVRKRRWEARVCDIDMLACDAEILPDRQVVMGWIYQNETEQRVKAPQELILPHPRLQDRGFVLLPLAEIAADWVHPIIGKSVAELAVALPQTAKLGIVAID